jgi:hypothetical protein
MNIQRPFVIPAPSEIAPNDPHRHPRPNRRGTAQPC